MLVIYGREMRGGGLREAERFGRTSSQESPANATSAITQLSAEFYYDKPTIPVPGNSNFAHFTSVLSSFSVNFSFFGHFSGYLSLENGMEILFKNFPIYKQ